MLTSCSARRELTGEYYRQNEEALSSIQARFKHIQRSTPFSMDIKDRDFSKIGIEIVTDTIRFIYQFDLQNHNLRDTLVKYKFNLPQMITLIDDMRTMHCTWITNLDYYEKRNEKFLVFLSLRHRRLGTNRKEKYFTLAFFDEPQPFDEKGRLIDYENKKQPRQINDRIFYRINDKVFFTLSGDFR